jgi:ABC-2 type transport system permease protein
LTNLESLSLPEIAQLLKHQALLSPFLPTTWLVNLVSFWQKDPLLGLKNLLFLFFSYLVLLVLVLILRGKFYLQAVGKTSQGRFIAASWDEVKKKARAFPYVLKGRMGALTEKDWLVVFRTPNQIFQIAFIVFLEIVYLLIIIRLPLTRLRRLFPNWYQDQLLVFNFLFVNYLTSVFSMRFLFPMISLEGHSAWIVWSAPIKRMKVFWQKFLSSFLIILIWLEISTFLSIKTFRLSLFTQWPLFLINLPLSLTMVAISLGMGAIKPNFWEKNPEKLSTSPGGIMATTLCLVYIGGISFLAFVQKEANIFNPLIHLAVWLISLFIAMPILLQVSQRIKRYEV